MARQAFTVAVAERSAQVVSSRISPVDSAISMNSPALAMRPSDLRQRSRASTAPRAHGWQCHLWLVHEQQITGLHRAAQRLFEAESMRGDVVQFRRVQRVAIPAPGPWRGTTPRPRCAAGHRRRVRDPGTGSRRHWRWWIAADRPRPAVFLQRLDHLGGLFTDTVGAQRIFDQHRKLIATQPCDEGVRAQRLLQAQTHHLQDAITEPVSQRVVDGFEVVQIDEQQRNARAAVSSGG